MAFFRVLAWILVALALMLIGADGISTLEDGVPVVRTTAEIIDLMGPTMKPLASGPVAGVVNFFLEAPLWAVFGILGIILTLLFRPID